MQPLVGVSLKLYFGHERTLEWCRNVAELDAEGVELVVIPSFTELAPARDILAPAGVALGAQDCFWEDRGAYTGEVSPASLAELGVVYVELGHAERRTLFGETDDDVSRKVDAALRHGLTPLICVGETAGREDRAIETCLVQLARALARADAHGRRGQVVIAYEPLWAIGADAPAGVEHVAPVCRALRDALADYARLDGRVIYGGSAGPGLLEQLGDSVDGLFLGRRAHDIAGLAAVLDEARAVNVGADAGKTIPGLARDAGSDREHTAVPSRSSQGES